MANMNGLFPHFLGILSKAPMNAGNDPTAPAPHPFRPSAPVLRRSSPAPVMGGGMRTANVNSNTLPSPRPPGAIGSRKLF